MIRTLLATLFGCLATAGCWGQYVATDDPRFGPDDYNPFTDDLVLDATSSVLEIGTVTLTPGALIGGDINAQIVARAIGSDQNGTFNLRIYNPEGDDLVASAVGETVTVSSVQRTYDIDFTCPMMISFDNIMLPGIAYRYQVRFVQGPLPKASTPILESLTFEKCTGPLEILWRTIEIANDGTDADISFQPLGLSSAFNGNLYIGRYYDDPASSNLGYRYAPSTLQSGEFAVNVPAKTMGAEVSKTVDISGMTTFSLHALDGRICMAACYVGSDGYSVYPCQSVLTVPIKNGTTGIKDALSTPTEQCKYYNLAGEYVGNDREGLASGLYVGIDNTGKAVKFAKKR